MLKYALVENLLAADPNNCVAVVSSPEVKDLNAVISFMISEGTGLTRPQAMAYFEKLTQTIEYFVSQGHRVVTPLFRVKPTIGGVFEGEDDYFDASRHRINIRTNSGLRLRELSTKIKLEKVDAGTQNPVVRTFNDAVCGETNLSATSGGIGVLKGKQLKFDPSDSRQGVFFASADDSGIETRADAYSGIKPSEVHFRIPDLHAGNYRIIVKTLHRNGFDMQIGELKYTIYI